jgi:predicted amidohydrolase
MTTLAALEVPSRFGDVAGTLAWIDRHLPRVTADVVLLPEACLTGYVSPQGNFDLSRFAEPIDVGPLSVAMAQRARYFRIYLGWPLIERDAIGRCFNTYCIHAPDGRRLVRYRKRHPWYPEVWATPGDEPHPVFELGPIKATLAICYDIHFLSREAKSALDEADVLVFPSAWVEHEGYDDTRRALFFDLARRFRVAIVNPNWGPGEIVMRGQGSSRIVGRDGREIVRNVSSPFVMAAMTRKH